MKWSLRLATLTLVGFLFLTGCGNQRIVNSSSNSGSSSKTTSSVKHKKSKPKSTKKKTTSTSNKQSTTLVWNSRKDKQLNEFIDQWAPTMNQSYVKYDGKNSLKTSPGMVYPDDLPRVNVEGSKASIAWSKDGKGDNSYNVVAIYNYNGTVPPLPNHITYFFTFHNNQPVVLVDQSRDGTPNLLETKNTKVKDSFDSIVAGNYKPSSENSSSENSNNQKQATISDPKIIGALVYEKARNGVDLTKEVDLGVYTANGKYWIGTGTSTSNVGFTIDGDTVHYFTKDMANADSTADAEEIEHTVSLSDLESQYYSTNDQKQMIQDVVGKMPAIENQ
ncbi:Lreu_0056 family protein [Companilactobacillus halodurans]|uniref:DUF4767 domain-containing protein n=1 Tax=Companilactobacillus halodurans TaxID=2584183 RepID=A0A5P0ZX79_9LACO|nr:DUF4767 domain-containing protein [Companilactobacillus halodurans]MQS75335.1 DUF4767 domain-containing protein [Companilactobacillus halodurans]MQS97412.1 DUF4767 domain-containing protein [Companilactobacillus halodurans]